MSEYQAVLMAPDGDYVTDHRFGTVEEVEEAIADQGSRWFFYPFAVVVGGGTVSEDSRIVRGFDYFGPGIFGGEYEGRTFGRFRQDVVSLCEAERARITCPKCHGSGKVSPEVAA